MPQITLMSIDAIIELIRRQLNDQKTIPIMIITAKLGTETLDVNSIEFTKIGNRNLLKILQQIITELSKEIPTEENLSITITKAITMNLTGIHSQKLIIRNP